MQPTLEPVTSSRSSENSRLEAAPPAPEAVQPAREALQTGREPLHTAREVEQPARGALQQALELFAEGKLAAAGVCCQQALELEPRHFEALHLLGIVNLLSGHPARAAELFGRALELEPQSVAAHANHGNALYQLGRYDAALVSYDRAIALNGQLAEAHFNRGNALRALHRHPAAIASYDAAIALKPDYADALGNRGLTLYDLRSYDAALASYERAIAVRPEHAATFHHRGNALRELKRYEAAIASYDRALLLAEHADIFNDRGIALAALQRSEEALASYERAVALDPGSPEGYANRANLLRALGRYEAAIASYDQAAVLQPQLKFLAGAGLYARMQIAAWDGFEARRAALAAAIRGGQAVANPLCVMSLSDSTTLQCQAARIWMQHTCPPNAALPPIARHGRRDRIRVGYFSADFRSHPVAMLTAPLFETHDRSRFELTGFSFGPDTRDEMRRRLEGTFDRFIDVREHDDRDAAQLARSLELDIAVDLAGFTAGARPGIFALRAAPIQVSFLGYPGTMAAPYIDYILADEVVIPAADRPGYSEKVISLPHCYLPPGDRPPITPGGQSRPDFGLPPQGFVFCAFSAHSRIVPPMFDCWMRLLRAVAGSVLWLRMGSEMSVRNLRGEAAKRGIAPERIVFAASLPKLEDHLSRQRLADLFLDTLPYNAHTTAGDALWAGLPVLSCAGEAFAARVGASLLRTIGLPELIATTPAHYESLAIELARDPAHLAEIRARLARNRAASPLFDTALFTRHLESACVEMHERYRRNLAADHFCVEAGDKRLIRR